MDAVKAVACLREDGLVAREAWEYGSYLRKKGDRIHFYEMGHRLVSGNFVFSLDDISAQDWFLVASENVMQRPAIEEAVKAVRRMINLFNFGVGREAETIEKHRALKQAYEFLAKYERV
jgi:hypothetical protein